MHLRTVSPPTLPAEDLSQLTLDNSYKTVILANSRIFNGLESWKTDEYVESLLLLSVCYLDQVETVQSDSGTRAIYLALPCIVAVVTVSMFPANSIRMPPPRPWCMLTYTTATMMPSLRWIRRSYNITLTKIRQSDP